MYVERVAGVESASWSGLSAGGAPLFGPFGSFWAGAGDEDAARADAPGAPHDGAAARMRDWRTRLGRGLLTCSSRGS